MNVAWTRAADGLPRRAFSVAEVRRMIDAGVIGEDERFELIEGEFVMMAAKGYAHELIKNALNLAIARSLPTDLHMGVETSIQFSDLTIVEPDIAVFRRSALIRSDTNFSQVRAGGLLLVVEVAATSLAYDREVKAKLYARHGVREFWVIDANGRTTYVHTAPQGEAWGSIVERAPTDALTTSAMPGFAIRLADIE